MSEIKSAFTECAIQSLKKNYIVKLEIMDTGTFTNGHRSQSVTCLSSRKKCSIDLIPKSAKGSDVLSILYGKSYDKKYNPNMKLETVHTLKYDLSFRKGYKPQFTQEMFDIFALPSGKPRTYTV